MNPDDWKPMTNIGSGVMEIRIYENGEFRVVYVVKYEETVYILLFQVLKLYALEKNLMVLEIYKSYQA